MLWFMLKRIYIFIYIYIIFSGMTVSVSKKEKKKKKLFLIVLSICVMMMRWSVPTPVYVSAAWCLLYYIYYADAARVVCIWGGAKAHFGSRWQTVGASLFLFLVLFYILQSLCGISHRLQVLWISILYNIYYNILWLTASLNFKISYKMT
jgi:hypothetical protein